MKDLTTGKEGRTILLFALPILLGNVFQQIYVIIDSIIVGNYLDEGALTAVGASFPVFFSLIALIIGLASGSGILIAQAFGAKQYELLQKTVDTMYIMLIGAAIIVGGLGIIFLKDIVSFLQLAPSVARQTESYLFILLTGLIFDFGYNGTFAILRSVGDSKTPLYFLIIGSITNTLLDLLFIVYFKWGVEGAALATIVSKAGAFITAVFYIKHKYNLFSIRIKNIHFDKKIFLQSFKIGFPSGLQQLFGALGAFAIFRIVAEFATTVTDAYSVAIRIDFLAMTPGMNFSMALTSFTGQNIGAGKIKRVKRGLKSTLLMAISISLILSAITLVFPASLMRIFTPDKEIIRTGVEYLSIVGYFYVIFTIMFTLLGVFRGAGDTVFPMLITFLTLWIIRVPLSRLLANYYGAIGIWAALPASWILGLILSVIYYYSKRWTKKALL